VRTGAEVGVLIIDSLGRAWRNGTVGIALEEAADARALAAAPAVEEEAVEEEAPARPRARGKK